MVKTSLNRLSQDVVRYWVRIIVHVKLIQLKQSHIKSNQNGKVLFDYSTDVSNTEQSGNSFIIILL